MCKFRQNEKVYVCARARRFIMTLLETLKQIIGQTGDVNITNTVLLISRPVRRTVLITGHNYRARENDLL